MEEQLQLESPPPVTNENQFMITHVHTFQKTKIMASGPITSWQMDGEIVETVSDFILGGSKMVIAAMKLKDAYFLEGKL